MPTPFLHGAHKYLSESEEIGESQFLYYTNILKCTGIVGACENRNFFFPERKRPTSKTHFRQQEPSLKSAQTSMEVLKSYKFIRKSKYAKSPLFETHKSLGWRTRVTWLKNLNRLVEIFRIQKSPGWSKSRLGGVFSLIFFVRASICVESSLFLPLSFFVQVCLELDKQGITKTGRESWGQIEGFEPELRHLKISQNMNMEVWSCLVKLKRFDL